MPDIDFIKHIKVPQSLITSLEFSHVNSCYYLIVTNGVTQLLNGRLKKLIDLSQFNVTKDQTIKAAVLLMYDFQYVY